MKKIDFCILFLLVFQLLSAQKMADGDSFFAARDFGNALETYQKLLKNRPTDGVLNYKIGLCLVEMNRKNEAIPYLITATEKHQKEPYLLLAQIFFDDYRFAEAATACENYLQLAPLDSAKIQPLLRQSQLGAEMIERVEDVAVADTFVIKKREIVPFFEQQLDKNLGEIGTFSAFFATDKGSDCYGFRSGRNDRIVCAEKIGDHTDLQISYRLLDGWTTSKPLSENLNSPANENFPFVLSDGVTIYFASDGENSIGGYDIFVSRFSASINDYLPPQNVGMPFNSPFNDYFYIIDEINNIGWLVTDRYQQEDFVAVYKFLPNVEKVILRDENANFVRDIARLKRFRKANISERSRQFPDSPISKQRMDSIAFVVNDSVVYSDTTQFVSREACQNFVTMCQLADFLVQKEFTLQAKRELWEIEDGEKERENLANEILSLEKVVLNLRNQIADFEQLTRKIESDAIKKETP